MQKNYTRFNLRFLKIATNIDKIYTKNSFWTLTISKTNKLEK